MNWILEEPVFLRPESEPKKKATLCGICLTQGCATRSDKKFATHSKGSKCSVCKKKYFVLCPVCQTILRPHDYKGRHWDMKHTGVPQYEGNIAIVVEKLPQIEEILKHRAQELNSEDTTPGKGFKPFQLQ